MIELPGGLKIPMQSVHELECLSGEVEDSDVRGKLVLLYTVNDCIIDSNRHVVFAKIIYN